MENKTAEDIEQGIFENMMADHFEREPILANNCFQKVDI